MAKIKVYLRVGKTSRGFKLDASSKPNNAPLGESSYSGKVFYPTAAFAIDLDIDDALFEKTVETIGSISVKKQPSKVSATQEDFDPLLQEPDLVDFDENCLPNCTPGNHVCGK